MILRLFIPIFLVCIIEIFRFPYLGNAASIAPSILTVNSTGGTNITIIINTTASASSANTNWEPLNSPAGANPAALEYQASANTEVLESPARTKMAALESSASVNKAALESSSNANVELLDSPAKTKMDALESSANLNTELLDSLAKTKMDAFKSSANATTQLLDSPAQTNIDALESSTNATAELLESPAKTKMDVLESSTNANTELLDSPAKTNIDALESSTNANTELLESPAKTKMDALESSTNSNSELLDSPAQTNIDALESSTNATAELLDSPAKTKMDALESSANANTELLDSPAKTKMDALESSTNANTELLASPAKTKMDELESSTSANTELLDSPAKTKMDALESSANENTELLDSPAKTKMDALESSTNSNSELLDSPAKTKIDALESTANATTEVLDASAQTKMDALESSTNANTVALESQPSANTAFLEPSESANTTAPESSLPQCNSTTTPSPGNDTTENPQVFCQPANNSDHLDSLPILSHSGNDSEPSALARRHGDIKAATGIHKETANMKKVKTVILSGETFDESQCHVNQRGPLYRLYGKSKYFADSDNLYNYEQAKEICEENGLDLAEVEDMEDHRSVQNFVKNFLITGKSARHFFTGANDFKEKGIFQHGDGEPLKFQNFLLSEPDDKNQTEDCVALMQEDQGGPVGAADVDCKEEGNVLCMFPPNSECYKESKETEENDILQRKKGLVFIADIIHSGTYHVSNFMLTWNNAFHYCLDRNMTLFKLDKYVTRQMFFKELFKWEQKYVKVESIPFQFWTSGRFQNSHLEAPVFFATKPFDKESSEEGSAEFDEEPESPHHFLNFTYAFSGVYVWSDMKKKDPGGAHNLRRDLCLSFGFEKMDETPVVRNTNCEIPQFFICVKEVEHTEDEEYEM